MNFPKFGANLTEKQYDRPAIQFKVTDRKTFIEFINLLRADLLANSHTWENKNLNDF